MASDELRNFVRDLSLRMEAREAAALRKFRRDRGADGAAEATVYGELREDLLRLLDGMSGPGVAASVTPGPDDPWVDSRPHLDPLWPGAVDAWLAGPEDDGFVPMWTKVQTRARVGALWAVHPDGARFAWLLVPGPVGWSPSWRRVP